jgi:hypothetical protein
LKLASLVLALLALAVGLVVAGCGDDDEEPESGATGATGAAGATLETKADWIVAADAICEQANEDFEDIARDQYPEGPPEGEDAVVFGEEVVIPSLESQHEQISGLGAPEGEEEAITDILDKLQAGIDAVKEDPGSFLETDALDDANAAAQAYGLKVCGEE